MLMLSECTCGAAQPTLLSEDADRKAIDDLARQVKGRRGPLAQLTRAKRDQLIAEVSAERSFEKAMSSARRDLLDLMELAISSQDPQLLLQLDDQQLMDFIMRGGMGLAVDEFIESQERIREAALRGLQIIEPSLDLNSIPELDTIQAQITSQVFEDVILPDTKKAVRSALTSISVGVPAEIIMSDLNLVLTRSTGRQLTEVKTAISQYGRSISAAAAVAAELDHYLYTGPQDGITRAFCKPLVNKVVSSAQMSTLNNGQGLPVVTSGGGYNCRHSWSPVTRSFIDSAGLDVAKAADIRKANRGGKR